MGAYLVRRLVLALPTMAIVYTLAFLLVHATPGGPWDNAEKPLAPQVIENIRLKFHLNEPLWTQYLLYLRDALHGSLGPSYVNAARDVSEIIGDFFPVSLQLGTVAMLFSIALGIPGRGVVIRPALRNALVPIATVSGILVADVITGSFFVETITRVPGIGRYFVTATTGRDYPVLLALALLFGVVIITMNILVDLTYAILDPQVRYG